MKLLDLTLPTPAENLACDEALLEQAEATGGDEVLRFWESPVYFVVVGYSNHVATEVNVETCRAAGIPILRRCTGGGTVVQGPGCLNYALILQIEAHPELATLTSTNHYLMQRHAAVLSSLIPHPSSLVASGHTDLAIGGRKFSGNAQRRKRRYLLFHGSFLYNFDLDLISKLLPMPSRQPTYRQDRTHRDFLMNLPLAPATIKQALAGLWNASPGRAGWPSPPSDDQQRTAARWATAPYPRHEFEMGAGNQGRQSLPLATEIVRLAREKYATAEWTFKF